MKNGLRTVLMGMSGLVSLTSTYLFTVSKVPLVAPSLYPSLCLAVGGIVAAFAARSATQSFAATKTPPVTP
jgi:hypothetical protein